MRLALALEIKPTQPVEEGDTAMLSPLRPATHSAATILGIAGEGNVRLISCWMAVHPCRPHLSTFKPITETPYQPEWPAWRSYFNTLGLEPLICPDKDAYTALWRHMERHLLGSWCQGLNWTLETCG